MFFQIFAVLFEHFVGGIIIVGDDGGGDETVEELVVAEVEVGPEIRFENFASGLAHANALGDIYGREVGTYGVAEMGNEHELGMEWKAMWHAIGDAVAWSERRCHWVMRTFCLLVVRVKLRTKSKTLVKFSAVCVCVFAGPGGVA